MQSANTLTTTDLTIEIIEQNERFQCAVGRIKSKEAIGHAAFRLWKNVGKAQTEELTLVFIHDIYDSSSRYQSFFNYLQHHYSGSINIIAIDLVGMGMSSGHRGHVSHFDNYCQDSIAILNAIFEPQLKDQNFVLMGVGLGGLVSLRMMEQFEHTLRFLPDGIVLINPLIRPTFTPPHGMIWRISKLIPRHERMRFMLPYRGVDICDDFSRAARFESDVNTQLFMTVSKATEIIAAARRVRSWAYFINRPTLILSSDGPLNDREAIGLFHKGLNTKKSRHISFENCSHDILNGRRQGKAFKLILNWLEAGKNHE